MVLYLATSSLQRQCQNRCGQTALLSVCRADLWHPGVASHHCLQLTLWRLMCACGLGCGCFKLLRSSVPTVVAGHGPAREESNI